MDRITFNADTKALLLHIEQSIVKLQDMRKYAHTASAAGHQGGNSQNVPAWRTVAAQCMEAGTLANTAAGKAITIATRIKEGKY